MPSTIAPAAVLSIPEIPVLFNILNAIEVPLIVWDGLFHVRFARWTKNSAL
jgi:hypothetical protein